MIWWLVLIGPQSLYFEGSISLLFSPSAAFLLCWTSSVVLLNDISDIQGDKQNNIQSLAVILGSDGASKAVILLRFLAFISSLYSNAWSVTLWAFLHGVVWPSLRFSRFWKDEYFKMVYFGTDILFWVISLISLLFSYLGLV